MKIAVPAFGEMIAATFDFAGEIVILDCINGIVINKQRSVFIEEYLPLRAAKLKELGIEVVICGAISNPAIVILQYHTIRVIAGIAGEIDAVTSEFLNGNSTLLRYSLPGFAGRGCVRKKQRRSQCHHRKNRNIQK